MTLADETADELGLSVEQTNEMKALGQLQETYSPNPSSRRGNVLLLWVGIMISLLLLGSPVYVLFFKPEIRADDPQRKKKESNDEFMVIFGPLVGIFWLVACGWRLGQLARGQRVRILVFEDGLARFDGNSLASCRWDDIQTVERKNYSYSARGIPVATRSVISLGLANGGQIVIDTSRDHLAGIESLHQRISQETTNRLLPRTIAAIDAGQIVSFGQLSVSRQGLHFKGDQILAWSMVESISSKPPLRIRAKNGSWLDYWNRWSRRGFKIANLEVFFLVTQHYFQQDHIDLSS